MSSEHGTRNSLQILCPKTEFLCNSSNTNNVEINNDKIQPNTAFIFYYSTVQKDGSQKKQQPMEPIMENDLLLRIFSLLLPRDLARCAVVCSSWNRTIELSTFLWKHAYHNYESFLKSKLLLETVRQPGHGEQAWKPQVVSMEQHARFVYGSVSRDVWKAHSSRVNCCKMAMDTVATGSSDSTIRLWSIASLRCTEEYIIPKKLPVVEFEFDESKVLGAAGSELFIWKRGKKNAFRRLGGHDQWLYSMYYMDPEVVVGCGDGTIRMFDLYSSNCKLIFRQHTAPVTCISPSSSFHLLSSGSHDGSVQLCDLTSGQQVSKCYPAPLRTAISCIQMMHNGRELVAGTSAGELHCWDLRMGNLASLWSVRANSNAVSCIGSKEYGASIIVCGGCDGVLRVVRSFSGEILYSHRRNNQHGNPAMLSLSVGATRVVTSHPDGTLSLWHFNL